MARIPPVGGPGINTSHRQLLRSELPASILDDGRGVAAGDLLQFNGSTFVRLPKGTSGQRLTVRFDGTVGYVAPPTGISVDTTYGATGDGTTVDTAAVQNAVNAASALGSAGNPVTVRFTPGKTYKLGGVTPKSFVRLWGYGASIVQDSGSTTGPFLLASNAAAISDFEVRGFNFVGSGAETQNQVCVGLYSSTRIKIVDNTVTNWKTGVFYLGNCTHFWVQRNHISNCCGAAGFYNAINVVYDTASGQTVDQAPSDFWITDNYAYGIVTIPIDVAVGVSAGTSVTTRGHIRNNNVQTTTSSAWGIGIENSPNAAPVDDVSIINNKVDGGGGTGINAQHNSATVTKMQRIKIADNTITNASPGIALSGIYSQIARNTVTIAGAATQSAILMLMSGGASSPLMLANTITDNTIHMGAATGGANSGISVSQLSSGSLIAGNVIYYDASSTAGFHALNVQHSGWVRIRGNVIENAPQAGIGCQTSNDTQIEGNHIINPSQNTPAPGWSGVWVTGWTGATTIVRDNEMTDNLGTHRMKYGVDSDTATLSTMGNRISGGTAGTISANCATVTGV